MQKVAAIAVCALLAFACAKSKPAQPLSEPGETLYLVKGVVVGRDVADNTLRVDHEAIPGYMEAMTMDYPVRGVAVGALPQDKTRVEAKLHVHEEHIWLTDVKPRP